MTNEHHHMIVRLASCYQQGRLVPFLGAGMSIEQCPDWEDFIIGLENQAFCENSTQRGKHNSSTELIRRANKAVRHLQLSGSLSLPKAVSSALKGKFPGEVPAQTEALARFYWPLVLTTNYDDVFYKAWNKSYNCSNIELQLFGRSPADCTQVLASLHGSRSPILWALQGYIGEVKGPGFREIRRAMGLKSQTEIYSLSNIKRNFTGKNKITLKNLKAARKAKQAELQSQLVVGHEEYRRVAFTQPQFRRAFAEVFRSRNLLFLGSSLADQYFLNLFGEVLEIFGPSPYSHYALALKGQTDPEFLRSRLNTFVYEYDEYGDLPDILNELYDFVEERSALTHTWSYTVGKSKRSTTERKAAGLHIVRDKLSSPQNKECIALGVHVNNDRKIQIMGSDMELVKKMGYAKEIQNTSFPKGKAVMRMKDSPLFLYAFTTGEGKQDLRQFAKAIAAMLNEVKPGEYTIIRTQLLSGELKARSKGILAIFNKISKFFKVDIPVRFWLIETIRSYGRWLRTKGEGGLLELAVHSTDPDVLFDIETGRIDPRELLICDDLRFAVEVEHNSETLITEPFECAGNTTVKTVALALNILRTDERQQTSEEWLIEVEPSPTGLPHILPLMSNTKKSSALNISLTELGVVPDSVLRFVRIELPKHTAGTDTKSGAKDPVPHKYS